MVNANFLNEVELGSLVELTDENTKHKVHIIWEVDKDEFRICRPKMVQEGTGSQEEKDWRRLEDVEIRTRPQDYQKVVAMLGREYCQDCLKRINR